ncbi:MAG: mercuric ion transport protein [Psychromonas sp.]|jgi:mercuric ion transport protein
MKNNKPSKAIFSGVLAALAASSCCIPPLIALVAGVGGASSSLSWVEPLRPYLIGFAIISLGYAWYIHLKPKPVDDCGCDIDKPKFYQTRGFLVGITLFATLSISLPYYSGVFYSSNKQETVIANENNLVKTTISITGMTCDACQQHVDHSINELDGIVSVKTSYSNANSVIQYDKTKTNKTEINNAINSTGYKSEDHE